MALIHSVPNTILSSFVTFEDLAKNQLLKIKRFLEKLNTIRVDLVYDSYSNISSSIKNPENDLRRFGKSPLIIKINNDLTTIPKQWARYMALTENKRDLINYISRYITKNINIPGGKQFLIAGALENETNCYKNDVETNFQPYENLKTNHNEADTRMFLHAKDAIVNGESPNPNIIIHSPDTDVFVLGIAFWPEFKNIGCRSMWIVAGVGEKRRALGCHIASETLGIKLSTCLPALHAFTGCDTTSKVGTKRYAFSIAKASDSILDVLQLLNQLNLSSEQLIMLEDLYLKIVKKKGSSCDESRYIHFLSSPLAINDISNLPPTCNSLHHHILRCSAQLYYWKNSTVPFLQPLDLPKYGYRFDENGAIHPLLKTLPALPEALIPPCTCKNCQKTTCKCFVNNSSCCSYCSCKEKCKNPITLLNSEESDSN